ncbi:MaoC family dehydratase [Conexibacter woesei]|uniref:MaoC domain protein dehydratase n=1 Tax=Conexibacter woesei (strain DSM 14684 / CCUG 47730 / CIP 108061 / JCM 11494 / NBRC 100937 / ID131577) TaxID=469383 RepID=D3F5E3_CONWI|nr:MaoC family dehydratase [Conexibacter woesei]ADB50610.1 MaoC domain protein dehydratase [Conexibacter woesei DSM 14684]
MSLFAYRRAGRDRYVERYGLDFEDLVVGQRFRHRPGVTVSQQDNSDEALDTLNSAMLHFDAAYAAHTPFARPLVVSTLTVGRVLGMTAKTFGRRTALLGIERIELPRPVFGGDTLYAESEVLALDDGDGPDSGTVELATRGLNGDGDEVARLHYRIALPRAGRAAADPPGDAAGPPAEEPRFAAYARDGDVLVERFGLFFEDCRPGETFVHAPRRTVLLEDAVEHARRSLDHSPRWHELDGERRYEVPPTYVLAVAATTSTRTFARVVANLGWYDVELPRPVHAGDTLRAESQILDARPSRSRPREGVLVVATHAFDQHGEPVLRFRRHLLVNRSGTAAPYRAAGYAS